MFNMFLLSVQNWLLDIEFCIVAETIIKMQSWATKIALGLLRYRILYFLYRLVVLIFDFILLNLDMTKFP